MNGNVISKQAQMYIDEMLENARNRKMKPVLFRVGDTVQCVIGSGKTAEASFGTVIRVEADQHDTVYTVLKYDCTDYNTYTNADYGKTIFGSEEMR